MKRRNLVVPAAFAAGFMVAVPTAALSGETISIGTNCVLGSEQSAPTQVSDTQIARQCCVKRWKGVCVQWGRCPTVCATTSVRG